MWFDELLSAPNRVVYLHKESDTVLVSDSSKSGFGALLFSEAEVRVVAGAWSAKCRDLHINVLEMRAARLAIRMFSLEKVEISLVLDNTSALHVLKKERSRSFMMNKEVGMFIEEITLRRVTITSLSYIDLKGNPADYWSRICENQFSQPIILRFPTESFACCCRGCHTKSKQSTETSFHVACLQTHRTSSRLTTPVASRC
jgi:hypothetical protein